jgi:hypothetical protein
MSKFKFLSLAVLSLGIPASALAQTYTPEQIAVSITNLNAAILRNPSSPHNNLWSRMRQDFRMSEVNPEIVRRHETYYSTRSAYFNRTVERSRPYLYHILSEVEKRNMPSEIALLPFIESAFVTKARSHVGASGLWQFMPATGRHYGLAQNHIYDGRHDIYASTNAALDYLQYLHNMFGDWSLALAAYNWGEGNVNRAVNRARSQGLEPVYENLNMPNETRNYVPKLLAVRNLVSNPQVFGLNLADIENKPYFAAISIDSPMDINAITRLANISQAEFEALNPSFKVPVFMPENGQRKLLLPVGAVNAFEHNLRNAPKESLLSYDILRSDGATTLSDIADRNGVSVTDLRRTNGLSSNTIRAGLPILVAKNSLNNGQLGRGVQMLADNKPAGDDPLGNLIRRNSQNVAERTSTVAAAKPAVQPAVAPPAPVQVASAQPTRPPEPVRAPVQQATNPVPASFAALAANSPRPAEPAPHATSSPDIQVASAPTITQTAAQTVEQPATPSNINTPTDRLPETAELADNSNLQPDPLMSLANLSSTDNDTEPADTDEADNGNSAASAVHASLAQTEAQEARRQAQAEARRTNNAGFGQLAANTGNNQRRAARQEQQTNRRGAQTVTHKVQSGESLYSIARRYNVDMAELSRANNLRGNNIHPGQVLNVSGGSNQQAANRHADNKPNSRNERGNERNNRAGNDRNVRNGRQQTVSHTVRSGDTLQSIARRYNTSVADIKRSNNLGNSVLHPGQKLRVSSGT